MNVDRIRSDFPALVPRPDRPVPVYLDSACMSLVPRSVLDSTEEYYRDYPGCAGRSLHRFAERVGEAVERSRGAFARYLGRSDPAGTVFLRNTTEAIGLVGQGIDWHRGERVLISDREHNSNLVLWQRLRAERGIRIEVLALPDDGSFDFDALEAALAKGVRLVSLFHTSNLDGRTLPVREIVERAHDRGARVLLDGAQAAPHERPPLDDWSVDFYALSAHKMLGPSGTGVLSAAPGALEPIRPLLVGGETVAHSDLTGHRLRPPPHRFEAGLQNYAGIIGAGAALAYLESVGVDAVRAQQLRVNRRVSSALADEPRVGLLGPSDPAQRPSLFAFTLAGVDPHDAALFLDEGHDVMVRSGMHCVHSFYAARGLVGNVRASFYLYNHDRDADALVRGVTELLERVGDRPLSGTSVATTAPSPRRGPGRSRGAGSRAAAARSVPPPRRAARGRAAFGAGSG